MLQPKRFVCKVCRGGPFDISEVAAHDCKTDPTLVHYSIGHGLRQCGATTGRMNFDGPGVDCPLCSAYLKKRIPK